MATADAVAWPVTSVAEGHEGRAAFLAEERDSIRLAMRVRVVAVAIIAVWVFVQDPRLPTLYYVGLTCCFLVLGLVQWGLLRPDLYRQWQKYLFITLDVALLTVTLLTHNPFEAEVFPLQVHLRFETFLYFYVLLGFATVTFSPRLVVWTGGAIGVIWSVGVARILALPDTRIDFFQGPEGFFEYYFHPNYVDGMTWVQQIVLVLITAAILAVAVRRAQRLVRTQTRAARERANLARYFSPNMVDALAHSDEPLGAVRTETVAVLFADIVGFTGLAEGRPAEDAIAMLRAYHRRMAGAVFAHDGTLDKYMGDAVMATFGTPRPRPRDATRALECALAVVAAMAEWSLARKRHALPAVRVGIGVHYGPGVLGDIGDERRLEFAVIGDTVNVASRLEAMTRELDAAVVVSEELIEAVRRENPDGHPALARLVEGAPQTIRGREGPVPIRLLPPEAAP